jgi:hypothetical protein
MRAATRIPEPFDGSSPRCTCLVRVLCSPGSDSLDATHQFLTSYAKGRFRAQIGQRLSVAAYELLSNALNYSSMSEEIAIEVMELPEIAAVRVANATILPRISMLNEHMNKIRAYADGMLAEEMRRTISGGPVRPMLGLARVVNEVTMQLDALIEGQRVTMTASCRK